MRQKTLVSYAELLDDIWLVFPTIDKQPWHDRLDSRTPTLINNESLQRKRRTREWRKSHAS